MGYYTFYDLEVKGCKTKNEFNAVIEEMKKATEYGYSIYEYAFGDNYYDEKTHIGYVYAGDSIKWYVHERDMVTLSLKFRNLMFKLNGNGEEHDDFWYGLFKNGEYEIMYGSIVYEEPSLFSQQMWDTWEG